MREQVVRRAKGRCEYCKAPQSICAYTFHIEHIVPKKCGGTDALQNLALSCFFCNSAKRANQTGEDPSTGKQEPLFNPREHEWEHHFKWSKDCSKMIGVTPIGRATIGRLDLNKKARRTARLLWVITGTWP